MAAFLEFHAQNLADVQCWMPAGDRKLKMYLKKHPIEKIENQIAHLPVKESRDGSCLKVILNAGRVEIPGWLSLDKKSLNPTSESDFKRALGDRRVVCFLAEHVWEHFSDQALDVANTLAFQYLQPGGCLRIAVPDGLHPDIGYIDQVKPGGTGPAADDHKQLFTHETLSACLEASGFAVEKLEYWDEQGVFNRKPWRVEDGPVKRSAEHDRRNRHGKLAYTSLIVDAWKPLQ